MTAMTLVMKGYAESRGQRTRLVFDPAKNAFVAVNIGYPAPFHARVADVEEQQQNPKQANETSDEPCSR
jgi:hypothetical protein